MLVGRAVLNRKTRVDEVKSFEIKFLMDIGILKHKDINIQACRWKRWGKPSGFICYRMYYDENDKPKFIRFSYSIRDNSTKEKQSFDYPVRLVATDCNFGGKRWWFICPLTKNGVLCGRRCSILYLPGDYYYFGCRICYELTYESRQRHREGFYEYFEKPYNRIKQANKDFEKAKYIDEKLAILKVINENKKIIDDYDKRFYQSILKD